MERILVRLALLAAVAFMFASCATTDTKVLGSSVSDYPGVEPLYDWLEREGYQEVVRGLTENPDLRGRRYQIVAGTGDSVSVAYETDRLTEEIADGLRARAFGRRGFVIVPRRPPELKPGFKINELNCELFKEHDTYLTITVSAYRPESDLLARIRFNAFDAKKNTWISGFSVFKDRVRLTRQQMEDLKRPYADSTLKGTAIAPYAATDIHQLALFLAQSLTCKYQPYYSGESIVAYPEYDALSKRKASDILSAIEKNLNSLNEIFISEDRNAANWLLKTEMKLDGPKPGSHSLWAELVGKDSRVKISGVSAQAFVIIDDSPGANFSGHWNILDIPSNRRWGQLHVFQLSSGRFAANVLGPDANSLVASDVDVEIEGKKIRFVLVDNKSRTIDFEGVLFDGGGRIAAKVRAFPPPEGFSSNKVLVKLND